MVAGRITFHHHIINTPPENRVAVMRELALEDCALKVLGWWAHRREALAEFHHIMPRRVELLCQKLGIPRVDCDFPDDILVRNLPNTP